MAVSAFRAALRAGEIEREEPSFLSVAEAARLLGTSEMTLYRAISAGEFPAVRIRGRIIVPRAAIDRIAAAAMDTNGLVEAADHSAPRAL